jgi:hypothetical protein
MSKKKEEMLTFKNELGKEVKITLTETSMEGYKGAKNVPVNYKGIHLVMSSVDHNMNVKLTKKELDKLRFFSAKCLKEFGKKSEV